MKYRLELSAKELRLLAQIVNLHDLTIERHTGKKDKEVHALSVKVLNKSTDAKNREGR